MEPAANASEQPPRVSVMRSPRPLEYYGTEQLWPESIDVEWADTNYCETNAGSEIFFL